MLKEYEEIKKEIKVLIINKYVWYNKRKINIRKKEFTGINYKRLQKSFGLNRKEFNKFWWLFVLNSRPYGFDKIHMDKELVEDKLYKTMDQYNERKTIPTKFFSILLNNIHPFYDGSSRTCKILFANHDIIR